MLLPWFLYYLAFVKAVPMGHQITIERSLDIDESSEEFINSQNPGLCTTKFCHQMANTLLESKDDSVHPCDDFYLHACGNWIKKNPIPDNELEWSRDREILHKTIERIRDLLEEDDCNDIPPVKLAKKFYRSCMDTDAIEKAGIKPIQEILDISGGWPMAMPMNEWDSSTRWQDIDCMYILLMSRSSMYNLEYQRDEEDASKNILRIDQYVKHPVNRKHNADKIKFNINETYKHVILQVAKAFIAEKGYHVEQKQLEKDAEDMITFEAEIEKMIDEEKEQQEAGYNSTIMTLEGLQRWYNSAQFTSPTAVINFLKTFQSIFKMADIYIQPSEKIFVQNKDTLHTLARLLDKTPARTIVNYVHWNMMSEFLPSTNQQMRDIIFSLRYAKYNISSKQERWRMCVTNMELRDTVAYMFVKRYFPDRILNTVATMIGQIQDVFEARINKSPWITQNLKLFMTQKMENMMMQIGYPEWYTNETAIIHQYDGLAIGSNYFENLLNCQHFDLKQSLKEFRKPSDRTVWLDYAFTVNAFYSETTNVIILPAAELQDPYFTESLPDAVNYGAIGFIIGHELSHAYDTDGVEHDKDGKKVTWAEEELHDDYDRRTKCFVNQFNNYSLDIVNEEGERIWLNGNFTEDENMADSMGLRAAFAAYQRLKRQGKRQLRLPGLEDYSDEKLFFLTFANAWCTSTRPEFEEYVVQEDKHSPPKFRVIGSLSNMKLFSKAFDCPLGSPMNPTKKCDLWR
ncbi:hypothetical protein KM043_002484 [Ampulex compressa]|uniref:Membrane metallo-endopeptidase-like protein n=1 Tax=Ampulex compressa TaxID=860918 RepID=A0A1W6EVX7_AMPCP|nr:membrane metallo-endopeptidase-like protein [Ampulex compressa]KAG7213169.1 hypothetical protein KM043_002484 [Ampulex compressa]